MVKVLYLFLASSIFVQKCFARGAEIVAKTQARHEEKIKDLVEGHKTRVSELENTVEAIEKNALEEKSRMENAIKESRHRRQNSTQKLKYEYRKSKRKSDAEFQAFLERSENEYNKDLFALESSLTEMCFPEETPVSVVDGSEKGYRLIPISSIRQGDLVVTYNIDLNDGVCDVGEVAQVMSSSTKRLVQLFFKGKKLRATENHPVFVVGLNKWVPAKDLNVGDQVLSISGELLVLEGKDVEEGEFTVYNLEVQGNHNYFAGGILVHNCNSNGIDIPEEAQAVLRRRHEKNSQRESYPSNNFSPRKSTRRCWCSII